jgi:predicted O-methyltransferase YrrM
VYSFSLIIAYLQYLFASKTKFDVHSPFIYSFITQILEDKTEYAEYQLISSYAKQLQSDNTQLEKNNWGAGSAISGKQRQTAGSLFRNTSLDRKYAALLFRLCNYFKPQTVIELGTGLGMSAYSMSLAHHHPEIITVEGNKTISEISGGYFSRLQMQNIVTVCGNFDEKLPDILQNIEHADMAFIDGNHREESTIRYFNLIAEKCHNDSVIIFDDIRWSKGMIDAWNIIKDDSRVTLSVDLFRTGIVFFRSELKIKQHFVLRF